MKTRAIISSVFIVILATMLVVGCTIRTTLTVEEYDVRLVNKSGDTVRIRWDNGTYYDIDNGDIIYISSDEGYYEMEWINIPTVKYARPTNVYQITLEADIDIEFYDDPDIIIIER